MKRICNVVMGTSLAWRCLSCGAPKSGRSRVVQVIKINNDIEIICLPCARRIGKAAEVKA
jgi:hypothetical protein